MPKSNPVRDYRNRHRLTQGELAEALGVARNYIYLIESGRKPLTETMAARLDRLDNSPPVVAAVRDPVLPYGCNIPATCDLPAELAEMRTEIRDMRGKLDTLLGLLGGPLRASMGIKDDEPTDEAG